MNFKLYLKQKQVFIEIEYLNRTHLGEKKILARSPRKVGEKGKKVKALHALVGMRS